MCTLLPMAYAADAPWADDAGAKLNGIYGAGLFTADDTVVTDDSMITLLTTIFEYPADNEIITSNLTAGTNLTRLQLAQIVCKLFKLAENSSAGAFGDCSDLSVITQRSLGVVKGDKYGNYNPGNNATNADVAVVFYRVLGKIGAFKTPLVNLKPGMYGYDEFMYLCARSCLGEDADPSADISALSIWLDFGSGAQQYTGKEAIWNAWGTRLSSLPPSRTGPVSWPEYDTVAATTLVELAVKAVEMDRATISSENRGIFCDVNPSHWFYDGVMYLRSNGVVKGFGNGTFVPDNSVTRAELAKLICSLKKIDTTNPADGVILSDCDGHWAFNFITHAIDNGYMLYTSGTNFSPNAKVSRQELAFTVFKSYGLYTDGNVNLSVLDRFSDSAAIGDNYKTAMAYLVSVGLLRGDGAGHLMPANEITRGEFGAFLNRVMMGLDKSKMHDYETLVTEVKS